MTSDDKRNHDNDNDNGNDQHESAVATAPAGGALASLAALGKALGNVDTAGIVGRSGLPMLSFKREGDGTWRFGQRQTVVEDGSRWAVNPLSFRYGYICFGDGSSVLGERLVPVSQPKPDVTALPDHGFPWVEQWCVNLKCLNGADTDVEVTYKPTTVGGLQAVAGLIETIRDRLADGQHDSKVAPVLLLGKDSYSHAQYGKVWTPLLEIVDWMALSGPAPAPAPESSPQPEQQPRRRRVG
jgi:hypothetical protein